MYSCILLLAAGWLTGFDMISFCVGRISDLKNLGRFLVNQ